MGARSFFGGARNPRLRLAAQSYVERVELSAGASHRPLRAQAISRDVLTSLATSERANLTYRFANFFALLRMAGADPLHPLLEPPVLAHDARRLVSQIAGPEWIHDENALRAPDNHGFCVYLGDIPRLSCFGFMLFEVIPELLVAHARTPQPASAEAAAGLLLKEINRALAKLQTEEGQSEHTVRKFFLMIHALEEVAGKDFEISGLRDDHVISAWMRLASGDSGVRRYTETLRMIAELTDVIRAGEAVNAMQLTTVIDDPLLAERISDGQLDGEDTRTGNALSDGFITALLTRDQLATVSAVLVDLVALSGIYLSRARALAFGPLENRLIQAKRDGRDYRSVSGLMDAGTNAFAELNAELAGITASLSQFIGVAVLLSWEGGRRNLALQTAVSAGFVSGAGAEAITRTGEAGPLLKILTAATPAWKNMRRRDAFATMQDCTEDLLEAVERANHLLAAFSRHAKRIGAAVDPLLTEEQYRSEVAHFHDALMQVHANQDEDAK